MIEKLAWLLITFLTVYLWRIIGLTIVNLFSTPTSGITDILVIVLVVISLVFMIYTAIVFSVELIDWGCSFFYDED